MGWQGTRMLTNGEHDELWRRAFQSIPEMSEIAKGIRVGNALSCAKELHSLGAVTDDGYKAMLIELLRKSGYEYTPSEVDKD